MIVDDNICLIIASAYSNVSWNKTTLEATHVFIDTFNFFEGITSFDISFLPLLVSFVRFVGPHYGLL
jgi:hypothetical protein